MNAVSNPPVSKKSKPDWLLELSGRALKIKDRMSLPHDEEAWRKIDLSGLNLEEFKPDSTDTTVEFSKEHSTVQNFDAITSDDKSQDIYSHVFKNLSAGVDGLSNIFQAFNISKYQHGFYIRASRTPDIVRIRHAIHNSGGKGASLMHRILIHVPDNCELTVVEEFEGMPSGELSLWNNDTSVLCGDNAKLNYIAIGNYTNNEYHFHNFTSDQGKDSSVHISVIHGGGVSGKSFYTARVNDTGGHFRGIGLGIGMDREFNDVEMSVEHHASHSESSLYYRTVQKDRSHSVFTGNLYIPEGLKDVHSRQLNNNILLDKRARAESMPKLIIKAESVQCDHGSTVGEINEEALLYLETRGIPEPEAKSLLVEGYATEIIDEIPLEDVRDRIRENSLRKIAQ